MTNIYKKYEPRALWLLRTAQEPTPINMILDRETVDFLLELNTNNRALRLPAVWSIVDSIKQIGWKSTETICVTVDRKLGNGQHRLMALRQLGYPSQSGRGSWAKILLLGVLANFVIFSPLKIRSHGPFYGVKTMEKQTKTRKPYTSDLTDAQWEIIEPMIPVYNVGNKRRTNMREVLNAVFYVLTSGCAWKNLPHDFPPEGTVRDYFHTWRRIGVWDKIHDALRERVRVKAGRNPTPSAASIDSQSLKSAWTAGVRGFDAGKKNQWNQAAYYG